MHIKIIFAIILAWLVFVLSCTPLFGGSRKRKRFQAQGMRVMMKPRAKLILLAAMAVLIFLAVFFFVSVGLASGIADWEENGEALLFMLAFGTLFPGLIFLIDYLFYADHILYDQEKILRGRAFHKYEQIAWTELARMEVVSSERFCLYDREGRKRVSVDVNFENFEDFRRVAQMQCRPERQLMSDSETDYQKKFGVRSGRGILRRKAGEYFLIPVLYLALLIALPLRNGASFVEAAGFWFTVGEGILLPILIFAPVPLTLLIPISMLAQQIDYDTQEITFRRLFRPTFALRWSSVRMVELGTYDIEKKGAYANLRVTLHYDDNKKITIYQHRFHKGFPEFEGFLQKMIERYEIPVKAEKTG